MEASKMQHENLSSVLREGGIGEGASQETGTIARDKDYGLIWFTEQCLSNALRLNWLHPGRRARRRLTAGGVLPPRPGRKPQGRRAGQRAAPQAARRLRLTRRSR